MSQSTCSARDIVVVGFEGVQSLDITARWKCSRSRTVIFRPCRAVPAHARVATRRRHRHARGPAPRRHGRAHGAAERIDTLIVAGGDEAALRHAASEAGVLPWLRTQVAGTRRIASICTGAFVLAAGGWLDGRRATTHWNQCAMLQAFRPDARIEPDAIYVSDPPFHTSAGVTAGIDLCLALVEADCGAPTALAVARELVLFMHRPGGQAQFSVGRLAGQRDAAHARCSPRSPTIRPAISASPRWPRGCT